MEKENETLETTNDVESVAAEQPTVDAPVVETPVEDKPKRSRSTKKTDAPVDDANVVEGMCLDVVGEAMHSNTGATQYRVTVKIPRRENYGLYLKEAVLMELRKTDLLYSGIVTWNLEKIEKCSVPVSFIGKDVFDLSRDECYLAKAYYGLGGFQCFDGDLRTVQKEIYRRFAKFFGIDNGATEEYLKWQQITLKQMVCPQGDTVLPAELPVAFDDLGDVFRKSFRK